MACNSANKPPFNINRVIDQNIQKLLFLGKFASYIAHILKVCHKKDGGSAHPLEPVSTTKPSEHVVFSVCGFNKTVKFFPI